MVDILHFCHQHGIRSGVTSNGSAFTHKNVERIVAAHPFNVNISCDAPSKAVHDEFRGFPGSFDKLLRGINFLLEERDKQNISFPIMIKTTISSMNFRLLPEIIEWGKKLGVDAINFQPLDRWTPETYDKLWINQESWAELAAVIEELVRMKSQGAPILNTEDSLRLVVSHYREEKVPPEKATTCRVGLRNYFIRSNGEVELCYFYPTVGNVKDQGARKIWYGSEAKKIRQQTTQCSKLCLTTCLSNKGLGDKFKQAVKLLDFRKRRPNHIHQQG